MKKLKKLPWIPLVLAVALAVSSGIAAVQIRRAESYRTALREISQGAVLSALRQMEDMDLALHKALLSAEPGEEKRYLAQVSSGAAQVQRSLSLLPLDHAAALRAVKFANQLADYTALLVGKDQLTEEDAHKLTGLMAACGQYTQALSGVRDTLAARALQGAGAAAPEEDAAQAYDSAVSYPTLIYDGPFSDARDAGAPRALGPNTITREEALAIARDFVGPDRVDGVSPGADMGGDIPCYGVTVRSGDITLQLAVTRQGGRVLWMTPDTGAFAQKCSVEMCRESALEFLETRGFENMRPTYFQVYEGVAVISFAASQGDTLLYPDLIKVQLRMDTAQVVGVEARNYLQNHGPRGLLVPSISLEEAQGAVSSRLSLDQARLCLIPTDSGEKLCYEFQGTYEQDTYLVYINAESGRQEQLFRVVEGETGLEAA